MRTESNCAQGIFQQLLRSLTYRLYSLYGQIEDIKSELGVCSSPCHHVWPLMVSQLAVDKLQLDIKKSTSSTAVPSPTASMRCLDTCSQGCSLTTVPPAAAIPVSGVIELTLPLPATMSRMCGGS